MPRMKHKDIYIDKIPDKDEKEITKSALPNSCTRNAKRYSMPAISSSKDYSISFDSMPLYEIIEVSEDEQSTDRSSASGSPRRYSTESIFKNFSASSLAEFLRTTGPGNSLKEKTKSRKGIKHYLSKIFGSSSIYQNRSESSQEYKHLDINSKDIEPKNNNIKSYNLFKKRSHSLGSIYTSKGRMNYKSQIYEINDQGKMVFKDSNFKPLSILRKSISCVSSSEIENILERQSFVISFPRRIRKKSVKVVEPSHRDIIYISDDEEYQNARRGYDQQILDNTFQYFFDISEEFDIESDRILSDLQSCNPDLEDDHTIDMKQYQIDTFKDSKRQRNRI